MQGADRRQVMAQLILHCTDSLQITSRALSVWDTFFFALKSTNFLHALMKPAYVKWAAEQQG